jgi:hypothetical protein
MRWTNEMHEAWKRRQASFSPSAKQVDTEMALREFIAPIPVLTDVVVPAPAAEPARSGGRTKYRNERSGRFASKREAKRAAELQLMQAAGEVRNLEEQVEYLLIPKQPGERSAKYTCDFRYEQKIGDDWILVVEDIKSEPTKTQAYVLRRKLMQFVHGIKIKETT